MRRAADSHQRHARSAGQGRPDTASRPGRGAHRTRHHEHGTAPTRGRRRGRRRVSQARRFDAPGGTVAGRAARSGRRKRRARDGYRVGAARDALAQGLGCPPSPAQTRQGINGIPLFDRWRRCGSGSVLMSRRFSLGCHSTRASRRIPALFRSFALSVFLVAILLILPSSAFAWDSHTHKLITRLAVEALPSSPLAQTFAHNERQLEEYSVDPDTVLRAQYGEAEARRHYIDLEYFGAFPFPVLEPNFPTMQTKFSSPPLALPAPLPCPTPAHPNQARSAWRKRDCAYMRRHSGYMA